MRERRSKVAVEVVHNSPNRADAEFSLDQRELVLYRHPTSQRMAAFIFALLTHQPAFSHPPCRGIASLTQVTLFNGSGTVVAGGAGFVDRYGIVRADKRPVAATAVVDAT